MKKLKEKILKIKKYFNKEIKYTNADDIAIALAIISLILFDILIVSGIAEIINLLEQ